MIQRLPNPARSASRAHAIAEPGSPRPVIATPRLAVQRESIDLTKRDEERVEAGVRGGNVAQPRATGGGILEAARGEQSRARGVGRRRAEAILVRPRRV